MSPCSTTTPATSSPLLGAEVPATLLHVYFCGNHKWNPAFDEHDDLIEALVTDTERGLCGCITRPGWSYRLVDCDPHKQFILRRRDMVLRPWRLFDVASLASRASASCVLGRSV